MSDGNKTEQPTQRRLQKAREQGQFPVSREFVAAVQFAAFTALLIAYAREWFQAISVLLRELFATAFRTEVSAVGLIEIMRRAIWMHLKIFALYGGGIFVITAAVHLVTTNFGFATKRLMPEFSRLNPIPRFKQLRRQNLSGALQALVLIPIFLYSAYSILADQYPQLMRLPFSSIEAAAARLADSIQDLLWKAVAVFVLLGCVDLYRQRRKHVGDLKMTKQEIRDEHKEVEGNPQVKGRIRKLQRDLIRRNMMKAVPTATAVVVNPTHYAVAIRYELDSMAAPTVVAKGRNYLARRIREIATEHKVPIVENVPLAQALYKSVEIGQEIPPHLYRAVAEILAYIFRLMSGR